MFFNHLTVSLFHNQEKIRVAFYVQKAALQFIDGKICNPEFQICMITRIWLVTVFIYDFVILFYHSVILQLVHGQNIN